MLFGLVYWLLRIMFFVGWFVCWDIYFCLVVVSFCIYCYCILCLMCSVCLIFVLLGNWVGVGLGIKWGNDG